MPPDTTCSPTSKDTKIVSGSIPPSGISPPNRQSAKPLNPVSAKSGEGHQLALEKLNRLPPLAVVRVRVILKQIRQHLQEVRLSGAQETRNPDAHLASRI